MQRPSTDSLLLAGIIVLLGVVLWAIFAPAHGQDKPWKLVEIDRFANSTRYLFHGHFETLEECLAALDSAKKSSDDVKVLGCKTLEMIGQQDFPI